MISISIVSHGQLDLVARLLQSLEAYRPRVPLQILVTENRDRGPQAFDHGTALDVAYTLNPRPRGLAANQNAAVQRSRGEYLCLLNPDVIFVEEVMASLVRRLSEGTDITAPLITDSFGIVQESARPAPTPLSLVRRRLAGGRGPIGIPSSRPDWIAGTFLFLRADSFRRLGGMDERYRLYFEDVDFGCRATLAGMKLLVDPSVRVIHDARRASARHPFYLAQHMASALRFFASPVYRQIRHHRATA